MELPWIDGEHPFFPHPEQALREPDGLLAVGDSLAPDILLTAYRNGIFPWFEEGQPVLWWSPSERAILIPGREHVSRSLGKLLRKNPFHITTNQAFEEVIACCAAPRHYARSTWITTPMQLAYSNLHRLGKAHSVECWLEGQLVGGLYGVQVGGIFCGESMFSRVDNASKVAFIALSRALQRADFRMIDCQMENPHLTRLGVDITSRRYFLQRLEKDGDLPLHWPGSHYFQAAITPT
jgi:leucyl/phenylalanyl-tRNA---protein transferase